MTKKISSKATAPRAEQQIEFLEIGDLGGLGSSSLKDKLYEKGIYYLTGEIRESSLLDIHQNILLKHLDPTWKEDIQIVVNSVGGETSEGWALIDLLDWVRMDVRTTGMGMCASLGAMILAAGTNGKRVASRNLSLMIHGASIDGICGNYPQLVSSMKDMELEYKRMSRFWTEHSKYSEEDVRKLFLDGFDHWLTPEDALSHGLLDAVVPLKSAMKKKK